LKTAHCGSVDCTSVVIRTLDPVGGARRSSITIGVDGKPLMSYVVGDWPDDHVKVAHCGNTTCTSGTILKTMGRAARTRPSPSASTATRT
jgi:hypothetical protein